MPAVSMSQHKLQKDDYPIVQEAEGSYPLARVNPAVAITDNNKIFISGGFDRFTDENDESIHILDLNTKTWSKPEIPHGLKDKLNLYGHTAVSRGNIIIIYGGEIGGEIVDDEDATINQEILYYNVESNSWSAPFNSCQRLRLGSFSETDPDADTDDIDFEFYDSARENESKPNPVLRHACCLSEDGESMYISGGQFNHGESALSVSSQLCRFDFDSEKWFTMHDFVARYDHTITAYNRKIWAFGGLTPEMDRCTDVVWYDLDSDAVGSINIIDDPMVLSYPTPSAATHVYTPGYQGTMLDVSLPGPATPNYPISITAVDLMTLKKRTIVHSSFIFQDFTWTNIFSRGPAFIVLGRPGILQDSDQRMSHIFYWDLREFGFLDPDAQTKPDEREGTLSHDLLQTFREGTLTDFEITAVQGDERPPLFHHTVDSDNDKTNAPLVVSTPSYHNYDPHGHNSLLDRNSPAPSLRAAEGVIQDTDSMDLSMTSVQGVSKTLTNSISSIHLASQTTVPNSSVQTPTSHGPAGDAHSTKSADSNGSMSPSPELAHRTHSTLRNTASNGDDHKAIGKDGLPVFKISKPIRVHMMILYARWPHFRRIMMSQMSEFHSRRIYLPEPEQWVRKLVEFMYSDSLEGFTVNDVAGLLILANLYELPRLRRLCLEHISKSSVSCKNAVIVYWRAHIANEAGLQKTAAAYCLQHWGEVVRTEEFQSLPRDIMIMLCQEALSPSVILQKHSQQQQLELERQHQLQEERSQLEHQLQQRQQRQLRQQQRQLDSANIHQSDTAQTPPQSDAAGPDDDQDQVIPESEGTPVNRRQHESDLATNAHMPAQSSPDRWPGHTPGRGETGSAGNVRPNTADNNAALFQPPSSEGSGNDNDTDDNLDEGEATPDDSESSPSAARHNTNNNRRFNLPTAYPRVGHGSRRSWNEIAPAVANPFATNGAHQNGQQPPQQQQQQQQRAGWDGVYDDLIDDMDLF